ncbi:MAG TPA: thioredoxin fold domain-containing protein [Gammaproteobacteria bacterium]|nr:thioredoxin fold domain-containing protein [Gammaproteobacteria bacterium]
MSNLVACKTSRYLGRFVLLTGLLLAAPVQAQNRWYDQADIDKGATLYKQNCASCHGQNGEGTADWKKTDANGNYPPPPLNGTAHTWHHSKKLLRSTISEGGARLGGLMPGFKDKLSDKEIDAVIAFFQSKWPDEVYANWAGRNTGSGIPPIANSEDNSAPGTSANATRMTQMLKSRLGSNRFSEPVESPVKGIFMTRFGSNYGYLTEDGRYLFIGNLIDLQQGENLTDISRRRTAIDEINGIAADDKIIFPAIGAEKAVLNVFTDTSCPYCKQLHSEISFLQQAGISVHYLPYPRGGRQGPGYQVLRQVWCAEDRARALTIAKDLDSGELPPGDCASAAFVDAGYALGNRIGVTGTPSLYKSNGENIQGYVPYRELIQKVLNN